MKPRIRGRGSFGFAWIRINTNKFVLSTNLFVLEVNPIRSRGHLIGAFSRRLLRFFNPRKREVFISRDQLPSEA